MAYCATSVPEEPPTKIPIPSDVVVREIAEKARSLDGDDERVTFSTHGLVRPAEPLLESHLFNPQPVDAAIVDGVVSLTFTEPLEIVGHGDAWTTVKVRADADSRRIESVSVSAQLA